MNDKYVTADASGGGDGSITSPWTEFEAWTQAVKGDRINYRQDTRMGQVVAGSCVVRDCIVNGEAVGQQS